MTRATPPATVPYRYQFATVDYHGPGALDRGLAERVHEGWRVRWIEITNSRPGWGLLFGVIGFWIFERGDVYHVTYEWDGERDPRDEAD